MRRVQDKIKEVEEYLNQLYSILPDSFNQYKSSIEKKAACERFFEKIVEAIVDLAFLIIKSKGLKIPEDDVDSFNILEENDIINQTLSKKLKNAKGMRNIIAHQYGKIDDELVYDAITKDIIKDVKDFIHEIKKLK